MTGVSLRKPVPYALSNSVNAHSLRGAQRMHQIFVFTFILPASIEYYHTSQHRRAVERERQEHQQRASCIAYLVNRTF